jgi:hypothetical protein
MLCWVHYWWLWHYLQHGIYGFAVELLLKQASKSSLATGSL